MNQYNSNFCEQIELTEHLIRLVPPDKVGWNPRWIQGSTDLGHLLGIYWTAWPGSVPYFMQHSHSRLGHFLELRTLPVNHSCRPEEALICIREYAAHIEQGFELCTDDYLAQVVPSVFVPDGEPLATLLLGNLEHLINHKYQLFFYLKLLGIFVTTRDIYQWRGPRTNALERASRNTCRANELQWLWRSSVTTMMGGWLWLFVLVDPTRVVLFEPQHLV